MVETATVPVRIVAVDREVYAGTAGMVVVTTVEGELGVLPGHSPLLGQLVDGTTIRLYDNVNDDTPREEWEVVGGYVSVTEAGVSVLVETAGLQ